MKTNVKRWGFGILSIALLSSCSSDPIEPESGKIKCKIDGEAWESSTAEAFYSEDLINISGQESGTGALITFTIQDNTVGSYALSSTTQAGVFKESSSASSSFASHADGGSGSLIITEINTTTNKISGEFEFVGVDPSTGESKEFTEGFFTDIPYTEEVVATFENEFSCKLNGSSYNPSLISGTQSFGLISINGSLTGGSEAITLAVPDDVTPGTYSTSPFGSYRAQYNESSSVDDQYVGSPGSITITSHNTVDNEIIGTFYFTAVPATGSSATDSHDITEGNFVIKY